MVTVDERRTLTEKEIPMEFGMAMEWRAEKTDYDVHLGRETQAASVVLATPWGILIRFSAPKGYCITSYSYKNGGKHEEIKCMNIPFRQGE